MRPLLLLIGATLAAQAPGDGQTLASRGALVKSYASAMVSAPPAALSLDSFYTKYADAGGIAIVASSKTDDAAVLLARDIVNAMLVKRADVRKVLVERGSRISIMAQSEQQLDLPEYRDWKKPAKDDRRLTPGERERYDQPGGIASMTDAQYWNNRARGMGGIRTSCAEENLLGIPGTKYYGEHICVHEFSHGIMSAIRTADPTLYADIEAAYKEAKSAGRFARHYAENTVAEYWAEGTQWWFGSNYAWTPPGGEEIWSPDSLKAYDPTLYEILGRMYDGHHIVADVYAHKKLRNPR